MRTCAYKFDTYRLLSKETGGAGSVLGLCFSHGYLYIAQLLLLLWVHPHALLDEREDLLILGDLEQFSNTLGHKTTHLLDHMPHKRSAFARVPVFAHTLSLRGPQPQSSADLWFLLFWG